MTGAVKRHDLVFVRPAAWRSLLMTRPDLAAHPYVAKWADSSWPLIRRRPLPGEEAGIALGLPLPPFVGRQRLALTLPPGAIRARLRPPLLSNCAAVAPLAWHGVISRLLAIDHNVRCFGSLAWQHMTGLPYLRPDSDLDLLWVARSPAQAASLAESIAGVAAATPLRLDGELLLPSGLAVQWREWLSNTPLVIAKSLAGVSIVAREALFP
jgi:phosphoribosyl-dephospho-CoA transferase